MKTRSAPPTTSSISVPEPERAVLTRPSKAVGSPGAVGAGGVLAASLPGSRSGGFDTGRCSCRVKGGGCESWGGDGMKKSKMLLAADVYVVCGVCRSRRYN